MNAHQAGPAEEEPLILNQVGINRYFDELTNAKLFLLFGLVFVSSRAAYRFAFGIEFDDRLLQGAWQLIDPLLLKTDLLKSLYYLHSQPPLYNFFIGVLLKIFGDDVSTAAHIVYLIFGYALYLSIYLLQTKLGVSRWLAAVLSTLFMISPTCILYENWIFYTYPLALVLILSGLSLTLFLETKKNIYIICLFITLTILAGTRTVFHLLWLFLITMLVLAVSKRKRVVVLAALAPLVFIFSIYLKNQILFGKFTNSTWLGMNFWRITTFQLPEETIQNLVLEGKISEVSLQARFSDPEAYPESYFLAGRYADIRALAEKRKSTGEANFNHVGWIAISDQYLKDDLYVLKNHTGSYLWGIVRAFYRYFGPASDHFWFRQNAGKMPGLLAIEGLMLGKLPRIRAVDRSRSLSLVLLIVLPLVFIFGSGRALNFGGSGEPIVERRSSLLYICFNILFITLAVNLIEYGENNRMRFMIDPFYIVLLGVFLSWAIGRKRIKRPAGLTTAKSG